MIELTAKEQEAYRLAASCDRAGVEAGSATAEWIFQCCGLWDDLQSLGEKVRQSESEK